MLIPVFALFVLSSIACLIVGIQGRKEIVLLALNLFWWLVSCASAYFTWLAWQDRRYSENWAMIGFMFLSAPFIIITGTLIIAELLFIRKWPAGKTKIIRPMSICLLAFLIFQIITGLLAA